METAADFGGDGSFPACLGFGNLDLPPPSFLQFGGGGNLLKCRSAAGIMMNDSRRLQNASTNWVDF